MSDSHPHKLLDGRKLSATILDKVASDVAELTAAGGAPRLVSVTPIVGDADFESCAEPAGWITPVAGGIGPVTISIPMRNAAMTARRQKAHCDHAFSPEHVVA